MRAFLAGVLVVTAAGLELFDKNRINDINNGKFTWKASSEQGRRFTNMTLEEFTGLLGTKLGGELGEITKHDNIDTKDVPDNFDSAKNWPDCLTIDHIRDQSACGSCWAFGAVEAMSDRYCTYNGKTDDKYKSVNISADDLNSCCHSCGQGCHGGYPAAAWQWWVKDGLCTEECDPYPFPVCEHHIPQNHYEPCPTQLFPTPKCSKTCTKGGKSKTYLKGTKTITVQGEADLQKEIMTNGPVEVAFEVYKDFETYKSGVYQKSSTQLLGGHAVKMTGWGVTSDGTKYWIINNSWNPDWGMNGQFWIIRGVNECGIEQAGWGGVPATF
jgi:C1A family cysteine protease